jgi:hypothetical protein
VLCARLQVISARDANTVCVVRQLLIRRSSADLLPALRATCRQRALLTERLLPWPKHLLRLDVLASAGRFFGPCCRCIACIEWSVGSANPTRCWRTGVIHTMRSSRAHPCACPGSSASLARRTERVMGLTLMNISVVGSRLVRHHGLTFLHMMPLFTPLHVN